MQELLHVVKTLDTPSPTHAQQSTFMTVAFTVVPLHSASFRGGACSFGVNTAQMTHQQRAAFGVAALFDVLSILLAHQHNVLQVLSVL